MSPSLLSPRRRARKAADDAADHHEPPQGGPGCHTDRRDAGPEDLALYGCACGYVFKAEPTTTIGCPHCGTEQAW